MTYSYINKKFFNQIQLYLIVIEKYPSMMFILL